MASFTPIWPRYRYDEQATGKCPLEISGYDLLGILSLSSIGSGNPVTTIISNYSTSHSDEVFYFVTKENTYSLAAPSTAGQKLQT